MVLMSLLAGMGRSVACSLRHGSPGGGPRRDPAPKVVGLGEAQRLHDGQGGARAVPAAAVDGIRDGFGPVSYTHLRAHENVLVLVCRLLLEKKKKTPPTHQSALSALNR